VTKAYVTIGRSLKDYPVPVTDDSSGGFLVPAELALPLTYFARTGCKAHEFVPRPGWRARLARWLAHQRPHGTWLDTGWEMVDTADYKAYKAQVGLDREDRT